MASNDYVTRVHASVNAVTAATWDALLALHPEASPFMRHAYLAAMEDSASASPAAGWTPACIVLERAGVLEAAAMVYSKDHS